MQTVTVVAILPPEGGDHIRDDVTALENQLVEAIDFAQVGKFDSSDMGFRKLVLYMHGPDAEQLFSTVAPLLRQAALMRGATVTVRRGPAGAPSRHVVLDACDAGVSAIHYLPESDALDALRHGRAIEQFLPPKQVRSHRVLRWLCIRKHGSGAFSVSRYEVLDQGDPGNLDLYSFSYLDPNQPCVHHEVSSPERALRLAKEKFWGDPQKYVSLGTMQEEYRHYRGFARHYTAVALPVPGFVSKANRATEIARVWMADGRQVASLSPILWNDPAGCGLMFVDMAKQLAMQLAEAGRADADVLMHIRAAFDAEWNSLPG